MPLSYASKFGVALIGLMAFAGAGHAAVTWSPDTGLPPPAGDYVGYVAYDSGTDAAGDGQYLIVTTGGTVAIRTDDASLDADEVFSLDMAVRRGGGSNVISIDASAGVASVLVGP
jgi:hypothetical protein